MRHPAFAAVIFLCAAPLCAQPVLRAVPEAPRGPWAGSPDGPGFDLDWSVIAGGGATSLLGGGYALAGTIGQAGAGPMTGGGFELSGGFWPGVDLPPVCYANCDGSTTPPVLNVNDFICFQIRYAAGEPSANCDGSTTPPTLNVNDFICFQIHYAQGCP